MKNLSIAQLVVDTKEVTFDFPGNAGFKVTLAHLSRAEELKIRQESMITKTDEHSGYPYQELDAELYQRNYISKVVTGWTGLTFNTLAKLILIDESAISDMSEEVDYSVDNAMSLASNSKVFDAWITNMLQKLDNFR